MYIDQYSFVCSDLYWSTIKRIFSANKGHELKLLIKSFKKLSATKLDHFF